MKLFITLQALDLMTTMFGLSLGGREVNPLLSVLFPILSPVVALVLAKTAAVAGMVTLVKREKAWNPTNWQVSLMVGNMVYLFVVVSNMLQISQMSV